MKTNKILNIALCLAVLCNFSCKDDFTDFESVGEVDASNLSESQALSFLVATYDKMQFAYGMDWHSLFLVKALPGDDANAGGGSSSDQGQLQDMDNYTVTAENSSVSNVYGNLYGVVAQANFLEQIVSGSSLEDEIKNLYLAEAKFFRAWCYMELTTLFGSVPLITEPIVSTDDFVNPRSPLESIYSKIEEDLEFAVMHLPNKPDVAQPFRVSQGTAQALMGKALVFQGKYNESTTYFMDVIGNAAHDLEPNFEDVWTQSGDYGIESLLEIPYSSEFGYNWEGGLDIAWGGNQESNLHIQLMGPRESENGGPGFTILEGNSFGILAGWGFNLPSAKLVAAYEAEGNNARKTASIATEAELLADGVGIVDPAGIEDYEGAIRLKFAPRAEESDPDATTALNYGINFKVFRYAEVLLLAAEAYNKSGNDPQALIELNKVRARAGATALTGLAGDALFDAIVAEKFLELSNEGQRFWDLVRWDLAATELDGTNFDVEKHGVFPIPNTEISTNGGITAADQNPGY